MQQKSILKNFQHLDPTDWSVLGRQQSIQLINNHTSDQFQYQKITVPPSSTQLLDLYRTRSQYIIPNTPQLILSSQQKDKYSIEILVQIGGSGLDKIVKKNTCEAVMVEQVKSVLRAVDFLVKKYGLFRITYDMVKVTASNMLLVWMHHNFVALGREYPLTSSNIYEDYKIMINDLISIFYTAGYKKQMEIIRNKCSLQKNLSFERFKTILQSQFKCGSKSQQKPSRVFQSPQFIKKKFSPEKTTASKRLVTQQFHKGGLSSGEIRYATSSNIGLNSPPSVSDFESRKDSLQKIHKYFSKRQLNPRVQIYSNTQSEVNDQTKLSSQSQFYDQSYEPITHIQQNLAKAKSQHQNFLLNSNQVASTIQTSDLKKKQIRQSTNSIPNAPINNLVTTSGKVMMTHILDPGMTGMPLAMSVGVKDKNGKKIKQTFKVKQSKIIEQKNQEAVSPNNNATSGLNSHKNSLLILQSQLQQDFNLLLGDSTQLKLGGVSHRDSHPLSELENEINSILN